MVVKETPAGTPIIEFTPEEHQEYIERETQRTIGMSVDEFTRAYKAGELDDSDPAVSELVGFLWIGQDGDRPS